MNGLIKFLHNAIVLIFIGLIRVYRLTLSPMLGLSCRFHPTCSAYALEALTQQGAFNGLKLIVKRVGRCHPWSDGGLDPVPPVKNKEKK
ncbi:membrane protein insertion efficiency factor YidD [Alphaproteobacteria bacterium]|nr:membrane protein insertion efficiency factor YidD [Alphaproteobacteria bacterium]